MQSAFRRKDVIPVQQVRRASQQDIPDILRLLVQVDMVHHRGRPDLFRGPATKYSAAQLAELLHDASRPVFVFDDGCGHVRGHAFCMIEQILGDPVRTDVKTLYIDDICVDEQTRRQQIGTRLYEAVLAYAREIGCYNVTLNVWACNPAAQAFYEHCGMRPQKTGMEVIL